MNVFDVECYPNYFLLMVRPIIGGEWSIVYERFNDEVVTNNAMPSGTIVGFNSANYDIPMVSLAMTGASNARLKEASDAIILRGLKPWDMEREFGFTRTEQDHIDLIEVAPGQAGLKIYGGRLHSKRLRDLPIEPSASITPADRVTLVEYCGNDLETTIDLYHKLEPQIGLRRAMSQQYGIDLRSKSDAQIAEAVIRKQVESRLGRRVFRPELHPAYTFKYRVPHWVQFSAPGMVRLLDIIRDAEFSLSSDGSVELPQVLESMHLRIGAGLYRMGIGGLHSCEQSISHRADADTFLKDRDVRSYYPSIILNEGLYPAHMGPDFLAVYQDLVSRRLDAKDAGDKIMADALKICVNGSFGKLGSKWSVLYAPDLLIQVTLTGQLALLMLIEWLEMCGFTVISANTDGIVIKGPRAKEGELALLIEGWEMTTGFETEETEYSALYSKDVNNYIAVKPDGTTKLKGLYAPAGMQKNPTNKICVDAAIANLTDSVPLDHTIGAQREVAPFLTIRKVEGGAKWGGEYLGRAVRWYYSTAGSPITYANNGNRVARSEGCRPLMTLPDTLPADLDYGWYVNEARAILTDIGAV